MKKVMTLPEFIQEKGINELAETLELNKSAIYDWKNFEIAPNYKNAYRLVKLSRGKLTFDSIYLPFFAKNKL